MAKVGMPCSAVSAAATASLVDRGLEAQSTTSAPPTFRVTIRLAVSLVTWRQAEIRSPSSGFSVLNRSRIRNSTGISLAAQSISPTPSLARPRSFTSALVAFIEFDLTPDIVSGEYLPALQVDQLDQKAEADHGSAQHLDQLGHRQRGPAGGDQVVHDQHPLARPDGVLVDVEDVVSVLQLVLDAPRPVGQFASL